jgi:hypothetical protein
MREAIEFHIEDRGARCSGPIHQGGDDHHCVLRAVGMHSKPSGTPSQTRADLAGKWPTTGDIVASVRLRTRRSQERCRIASSLAHW